MIGVNNFQGLTAPAIGSVQRSETERNIDIEVEPNEDGLDTYIVPHKFVKRRSQISGVGDAELAAMAAGVVAKGEVAVKRRKQDESTKGLPRFEIEGVALEDRVDPA